VSDTAIERSALGDSLAIGCAVLCAALGLLYTFAGTDLPININGAMLAIASALALVYLITHPTNRAADRAEGYMDGPIRACGVLSAFWSATLLLAAGVSGAELRSALDQLRPPAAAAYLGSHLCVRRQRADRNIASTSCSAPAAPGSPAAGRPGSSFWGYQLFIVLAAHRLRHGHHPGQGIR
jgi:hypothetical protein